jgi:dTDP-4-amino-4,6-dideoxygalactose transaminase
MTAAAKIPFLDLVTPHKELEDELVVAFRAALGSAGFIGGKPVEELEQEFAQFCGTQFCVGVGSGTDALRFALMAAGIHPGEIVITVANTFIATAEAISQAGALPQFVDIDERTYNMSAECLEKFLKEQCSLDEKSGRPVHRGTKRTVSAVIPVHLYGQMTDMDAIQDVCESYKLTLIEDACQAHGAEYFSKRANAWLKAGSIGKVAAFSFYPGKNLGACGEAGAITTNDAGIAHKIKMIRDHGQSQKYYHQMEGYNGRLDTIQAAFLRIKLRHLADWNAKRRENAGRYSELFGSESDGIVLPYEPDWSKAVYHLFVIRVRQREQLQKHLAADGIGTGIHYPIPLHLQEAYKSLGYTEGDFPITERVCREILSLPMFPNLAAEAQTRVVEKVREFIAGEGQRGPAELTMSASPSR